MAADNEIYDQLSHTWWDESGFLHLLKAVNTARLTYMQRGITDKLNICTNRLKVLDIGCGGGLFAEEFAALGCVVTGIDPSVKSLAAARTHAAEAGLNIDYQHARGEALPFSEGTFDIVCCYDVLEHVDDIGRVIHETGRVLRPSGTFFYDSINRTFQSKLIIIKLFQEWRWTSFMPPRVHDWASFITPAELKQHLHESELIPKNLIGLKPRLNLLRILNTLRKRKQGHLTYAEAMRQMDFGESSDCSVLYMGWAQKPG